MHQIGGYKKQKKTFLAGIYCVVQLLEVCLEDGAKTEHIHFFFFICKNLSGSDLCLTLVSKQDFFVLVYEHEASVTFFFSIHKRVRL